MSSAVDQLAFEPGQQIKCETRFEESFTGEVVAFDLQSSILIIKSPTSNSVSASASSPGNTAPTSTTTPASTTTTATTTATTTTTTSSSSTTTTNSTKDSSNKDLHFIMVKNCADIQVIEESQSDCTKDLPSIEMKHIQLRQQTAVNERLRLVEAVANGVSKDGITLFLSLSKMYGRASDLTWNDNTKIVVMNSVVIKPPYKESDCELLNPTSKDKEALTYVKNIVRKFWENL